MDEQQLAKIEARADAATPVPALIAEVRRLRAALEEAEARADATWHTLIGTEMCLSRMRERREESGAAEEAEKQARRAKENHVGCRI